MAFSERVWIFLMLNICIICQQDIHAQDFDFNLSKTENQIFYTDTLIYDGSSMLQKDSIINYLQKKYQSKSLPITLKDSTAAYVMSYTLLNRKSTLWFTAKFQKEKMHTKLILFQFEIQEPEEYNTPSPEKTPLEELYNKYHKNKKPSTRTAYEVMFVDIQRSIDLLKKELSKLIIKS